MIITPVILGILVLALLAYFGYSYLRRRAERKQKDAERTVSPFTFGGLRRAVDLAAELPPAAPEQQQQHARSPRSPRAGRRRARFNDEKVDHSAHVNRDIEMKEDRTVVPVFFAPAAAPQVVTRRPSTTVPMTQPYPLPTGKERDPFDALDEHSPTTPATRKGRSAAPTPINPILSPPADNTGAVNGAHLPFTPLPQYPASAHAQESNVRPGRRRTHAPVALDTRRFKLRVVNAGSKTRSSRTHSANPSSSGSISKTRPISASTHSTSSGVPEPPTYTRPPSYANSHASNNGRNRAEAQPLTSLLSLIGGGRAGDNDSAVMSSPVSGASGGTALRDSGLFPSGASTGDSIQDVQAVPGPSSRPMTPPVPALPLGTPSPLSPATSFMLQDPVASRRVSVASHRRSKRSTKGKLEPLKPTFATGGPLSTPPVTTPMSANPPSSAHARSSMVSEMDITSIRAQGADASPEGSNLVIRNGHQHQPSLDAKSARSVDVTSLYKGKHVRRGSAGSDDGVPAIPPLPMQTPFEFDLGFGGVAGSIGAISEESHVTDAASTSALLQRTASFASSSVASPLGPTMPFPGSASTETPTVAAKYSVAEWKAGDPWQRPGVARSASSARKVRRKPVPSEASFTSYGSETALLKGMERSDSVGSP
ncbi:hypothetical protein AURDEDRAFT_115478 [Auricularia subglabra TFB-10046 SS5]|uniref:Uncharacterized protein n=1 Tax=Auricularia subglabra (strain TFB-10046 / SS5) TaxID=717982 RepID=J0WYQ9_AURST|nr:hypothetical protein AURDEDRAFT_115478 [Auricularia subglabra TFB-10046 SS5]